MAIKLKGIKAKTRVLLRRTAMLTDAKLPFVGRGMKKVPRWGWLTIFVAVTFIASLLIYVNRAHAATQGPNSPSTASTSVISGGTNWTSVNNALTLNGVDATVSLAGNAVSYYLTVTNFGFTIPTGSTINGIQADVEEYGDLSSKGTIEDNFVQTIKGGTIGGTNLATTNAWPTNNLTSTYGGSGSLWGQSWTVSDINSSGFGIAVSAKNVKSGGGATLSANIDCIQVTVYYTPPPINYGQASYRLFNNQDGSATAATFAKSWGGPFSPDAANSVVQTSDGGYAIAGNTNSYGSGVENAFLAKYDQGGTLLWNHTWGGSNTDTEGGLIQTADGGFAMCGTTSSFGDTTHGDAFLARYLSTGFNIWSVGWGSSLGADSCNSVAQTSDGGYVITGQTKSYGDTANGDAFLAKFTANGTLSWSTTWGGTTGADSAASVIQTSDGGYLLAGYTQSFGSFKAGFIAKFTSTGSYSWSKTWGGSTNNDVINSVVQTSDGGYAVAGYTTSYASSAQDAFLAKFTSGGTLSWSTAWGAGTTNTSSALGLVQTSDGGYAITGNTTGLGAGAQDAFLAKFTSGGTLSWSSTFGGAGNDYGHSLIQAADGGYAIAGQTYSFGDTANGDAFLAKFNASGNIAGCSTYCSTPSATTGSPLASVGTPSPTSSSQNVSLSSITSSPTSPAVTDSTIISPALPAMNVGGALAAQNTAATVTDGQPFRLRMDMAITGYALAASTGSFKLQYAPMTTSCDASFTNTPSSAYHDVTDTSTVRYYDNPNGYNGATVTANANDPTDSTNIVLPESYLEKGTAAFTNPTAIPISEDGMWDFALTTYHALQNTAYCLRIVQSSGSLLNTYTASGGGSAIAEIMLPAASYAEGGYRLFPPAAATPITFAETWGGPVSDTAISFIQTSDGGYATAGDTKSFGAGGYDVALTKYDAYGNITWIKTWGGSGDDIGRALVQTSDGGYAVLASTTTPGFTNGGTDAVLLKYDSSGTLSWATTWGGANNDIPYSLVQTSDGGYAICGQTYSYTDTTLGDAFFAKFTSAGALSWSKTWGSLEFDLADSIIQTSDGGYAIVGQTYARDTTYGDAFIAKFTSTGLTSWSTTWGTSPGADQAYSLVQTSDGGYAMAGITKSYGSDTATGDNFLAKFTSAGALSWSTTWGGPNMEEPGDIIQTSDSGYAVTGQTWSFGNGSNNGGDVFLAKFTSAGALSWSHTFGTVYGEMGEDVVQTADGGYAIGGYGGNGVLLLKYDSSGNITNCGNLCYSSAPTVTTPSAATGTPTVTNASVSVTPLSPSATITSPTAQSTMLVPLAGGASVGSAITAQNKPYDSLSTGIQFRLRVLVDATGSGTALNGQSFKLQYARRGSDKACDVGFSGEAYADVTTATPVYYYNGSGNSGDPVNLSSNDPTDGTSTNTPESYQEANNFSDSISPLYATQSGVWDFSLAIQAGTLAANDYCLRVVKSDGTLLNTYNQVVDIAYGPSMDSLLRQGAWWNRSGVKQNYWL